MTDLPKIMPREMPQPEKRKKPTASQIRDILRQQNDCCNLCPARLVERDGAGGFLRIILPFQVDHIQRLTALGANTTDNLQILCVGCHRAKTKIDNREAKKGARLRGEAGQRKRRAEKGPLIKSGRKLVSRGFDRRFRKKMNGEVLRR